MHQVVVKSRGRVIESRTLKRSDVFLTYDGGSKLTLAAPTSHEWVETKLGHRVVLQRLVAAQEVAASAPFRFDRELRRALVVSAIILATMAGLVIELGSHVESKKVTSLDQKSLDMIFSAKTIKRKRSESQKVVVRGARSNSSASANAPAVQSKVAKSSEAPTPSQASVAPQADSKTSAALNSLRKSDLGSLIGKIAKRANRQGVMVAAAGVSPDKENAGHALIGATGSTLGGGGTASKVGATYRLGGVGTQGVGGGVSAGLKNGTGLASGHVGQGDVAALGNDEQTVIEGGLDKDAIAAVIKQNIGQIRYCYERQLSSNRELYGKVLVKWTIGAAGTVREPHIENSTMKSAMVEGCILRRLASWQFPIPRGGTQVRVSYPFLFKALD
jgi:outer membrane biosynthesis protein TonB